jgi:predicted ATPase
LTSFAAAKTRLPRCRRIPLVTVTGRDGEDPAGRRGGAEGVRAFADGAWLVELSAVHDPALVVPAAAAAIGCSRHPALL